MRRRSNRRLVAVLLTLAVLTGFVGTLAVWVNRQALNTTNWTNTSSRLLADPKIETALSRYLVSEVFSSVGVAGAVGDALPKPAAGLAGPLTTGLQRTADRVLPALLATGAAQRVWRKANHAAHTQLMRILNGGSKRVDTRGGVVTLDLRPLMEQLISRITVLHRLGITLPPNAGRIVIMRSAQLKTVQQIAVGIRGLAVAFTVIPLVLLGLALWNAVGWRQIVLRRIGWCVAGLGVVLLLARLLIGNTVVDALVSDPTVRGAATSAWLIGTSLLRDIAIALIVYGAVVLLVSWLGGETAPARQLRRVLAPILVTRPAAAYRVLGGVLLLLVLWGPIPPLRAPLPIIVICALAVIGLEALRRQTRRELAPPAKAPRLNRRGSAASASGTPRR